MSNYVDRIKPDAFAITTYLDSLRRGQYQIPTFQREVVWNRDRVKQLWDSICKFYPLGSILVWSTETRLQGDRQIGGHLLPAEPSGREFHYLLDGQQRTTALLTSIYGGRIKGQENRDPHLYVDLTSKAPDDIEDQSWQSRFLFWDEIDDKGGTLLRNTGRRKAYDNGLIIKLEDIAQRYQAVEERLEHDGHSYGDPTRVQLRGVKQVFDNYKLSFIELRGIEVAEVCQIFERINQAGQPLNMFDIVVAKTFRPASDKPEFYLRGMFEGFRHTLSVRGSGYASVDDMTLLQVLATLVREAIPDAGVYNITDKYLNELRTEHLEAVWEDGKQALSRVFDFLDNHLHLSGPQLVPYRYFYMSLVSYFFRNQHADYDFLKKYFWYCSFHNEDLLSNTTQLREHIQKLHEAKSGRGFLFTRFLIDRDRLRNTTYSSRGRLSRAILALYANQDPKDWRFLDRSVLSSVYYSLTDQPNLHHIFPSNFCETVLGQRGRAGDSLLNIAYLTQLTNLQISDRNPVEYLREFEQHRVDIELTHLLPSDLFAWALTGNIQDDALDVFIDARLELLVDCLRKYLNGIPFEVVDTRSTI
jgi:hypothetical protein